MERGNCGKNQYLAKWTSNWQLSWIIYESITTQSLGSFHPWNVFVNIHKIRTKFWRWNWLNSQQKQDKLSDNSWKCIRHVSVNWQVARYVMAVFNITTITDFATIVAITIDMLCTNCFKVTPFSGSPKKSVLSRRGLPSSSGFFKRGLGDNNLSQ